jgi:hypothetical protein
MLRPLHDVLDSDQRTRDDEYVDGLVNAVSELLASMLRRIGVVGLTRRRNAITNDLDLLDRLRESTEFGAGSEPHNELKAHIEVEVRAYTGGRREWRKREWFTVIFAAVLGAGLGYVAYRVNAVGWYASAPVWILSGIFGLTSFSALVNPPDPAKKAAEAVA